MRLVALVAMLAAPAFAGELVMLTAHGEIVLTDMKCSKVNANYAYRSEGRVFVNGCWTEVDGRVYVLWHRVGRKVYDMEKFTRRDK